MGQPGFVYVLTNPAMPGLVKMGRTERDPLKRCAELSSTSGVPAPFDLLCAVYVEDCHSAEAFIHRQASDERVTNSREFFRLSNEHAIMLCHQSSLIRLGAWILPKECVQEMCKAAKKIEGVADGKTVSPYEVIAFANFILDEAPQEKSPVCPTEEFCGR